MAHEYDEPWYDDGYRIYAATPEEDKRSGHMILEYKYVDGAKRKHYDRIVACVNACAGVEDPADMRLLARAALDLATGRVQEEDAIATFVRIAHKLKGIQ